MKIIGSLGDISAAVFAERPCPEREDEVPGMIPKRNVTLLAGDGGTGKSLLALMLAAAKATGSKFLGFPIEAGKALYLSAEDDEDEMHRRLVDICMHMNKSLKELGSLHIKSLVDQEDAALVRAVDRGRLNPTPLYALVRARVEQLRPRLLVIDTAADAYDADEINRAQVRQFIRLLRKLAIEFDLTVILLAHPSLSGIASGRGTSGSTGWSNSVRSRLYFERVFKGQGQLEEPDKDVRRLTVKKINYDRTGGQILLRWRNGVFVKETETGPAHEAMAERETLADNTFLAILGLYIAQILAGDHRGQGIVAALAQALSVGNGRRDRPGLRIIGHHSHSPKTPLRRWAASSGLRVIAGPDRPRCFHPIVASTFWSSGFTVLRRGPFSIVMSLPSSSSSARQAARTA